MSCAVCAEHVGAEAVRGLLVPETSCVDAVDCEARAWSGQSARLELGQQPGAGVGDDDAHLGETVEVAICTQHV